MTIPTYILIYKPSHHTQQRRRQYVSLESVQLLYLIESRYWELAESIH